VNESLDETVNAWLTHPQQFLSLQNVGIQLSSNLS